MTTASRRGSDAWWRAQTVAAARRPYQDHAAQAGCYAAAGLVLAGFTIAIAVGSGDWVRLIAPAVFAAAALTAAASHTRRWWTGRSRRRGGVGR